MASQTACLWCAAPFTRGTMPRGGKRTAQEFCRPACRAAFNNLRASRGAELYDLFRAHRRERRISQEIGLWRDICRLEERWQAEDDRDRPGRRSYTPPRQAIMRLVDAGKIRRQMTGNAIDEDANRRRNGHARIQSAQIAAKQPVDIMSQV